jgi:hypothetical protein
MRFTAAERPLSLALWMITLLPFPSAPGGVPGELWTGPVHVDYTILELDCEGRHLLTRLPDGEFVLSAHRTDDGAIDAEVAFDVVADPCPIVTVGWFGYHWPSTYTTQEARVRLYADQDGRPGELLRTWTTTDPNEVISDPYQYCIELADPPDLVPYTRYGFGITHLVSPGEQWGVVGGTEHDATARFRSKAFGVDAWTPVEELAPCTRCDVGALLGTDPSCGNTPTRSTRWGAVKGFLR